MKQKRVDEWIKQYRGGVYSLDKNNNIHVNFSKELGTPKGCDPIYTFILNRESFKNRAPKICGYVNYFFKYYIKDKIGFLRNLLMIKILIDDKSNKLKVKSFIGLMKTYLITKDVQDAIWEMVNDNYMHILDKNIPEQKNNSSSNDDYYRYQVISDKNGKRIMCASVAINLLYPLITHYTYKRNKKDDDLYQYFVPFLDLFSTEEIDNLQKLSMYTWSVVSLHVIKHKKLWNHRAMLGDLGKDEFYDLCLRKHIVTDSLPWLVFDNNMGSFFQKVLQEQLAYYIRGEYNLMPVELSTTKEKDDDLSDAEKFESHLSKIDESLVILSEENIHSVIRKIKSVLKMDISRDEIEFYKNNLHFSRDQHIMINYYFAKYFKGYKDLKLMNEETFIELAIIMKLKLIAQGMVYLPYILTGNLKKKGATNKISTDKILKKIVETNYYKELMKSKFGFLVDSKKQNPILKLLRSIVSSTYTYVDYDNDTVNGKVIDFDIETLIYEFLQFIDQI